MEYKYTEEHEYVRVEGAEAYLGISENRLFVLDILGGFEFTSLSFETMK